MKTREERQAQRASMPRTQLAAHHMENARLLPDRGELLYRIPNGGIGVEVGAAFGEYTAEILQKNRPAQLYLIDPWSMDRYSSGLDQIHTQFSQEIEKGQLHLMQGTSLEKLGEFEDDFLDWAYIDTDHSFELTWQELLLCEKKVKRSGRIAGHDFCTGNTVKPIVYGVVEAVNKFCKDHGWQFEFLTVESHAHFSYCLKRL